MADAFPRLRGEIDAAPARRGDETYYILYDRAGIAGSRLLLSPLGLLIAGRLDGTASVLDVSDALSREVGESVACGEVERVVAALDEALFLDGRRFHDYQEQAARDFRAAPSRSAGSAGSAYPEDPAALAAILDRMLREAPPPEEMPVSAAGRPLGVVAPHIDYPRGAAGYGQVYRALAACPRPETVVVIGTAHVPLEERFSLCPKDFDTPLGPVRVDAQRAGRIRDRLAPHADVDRDVLAHRGEHSIELQAVWLRHIYGEDVRIVPLLAASLGEFLDGTRAPEDILAEPVFGALAECLGEMVRDGGVLLMASADLSHVGPRFGDAREVSNAFLAEVEDADRDYLESLARGPAAGVRSLARHRDLHHVCGSAAIYAVGLALPGAKTSLLGYHQAVTPEMRQAVTYASVLYA